VNRRRIARLLERFSRFVFGPYIEAWEAWPQERLDADIDAAARESDRR
jgi:hypothetical protein